MILLLALMVGLASGVSAASDRILDFSSKCTIYKLNGKAWKKTDPGPFEGFELSNSQILKDEKFTVFKTPSGTYGVNQNCVKISEPVQEKIEPVVQAKKRSEPADSSGRGEWAAVFSVGLNLSPKGTVATTVAGATTSSEQSYKSSPSFVGGASYRFKKNLRLTAEFGISQLSTDSVTGNETSFFDFTPELLFPLSKKIEAHLGPTLGLYFFTQPTQNDTVTSFKQQSSTSVLLGLSLGADYTIDRQFDLGFFIQYLKPGSFTVTGTRLLDSEATTSSISTSYMTLGTRFSIHF